MKLQEVCEVYSGYALKEFHDSDEGYPVIKIGNICSDGTLDLEKCQFTNDFVNEKYFSKKGDIYVALSGATTGKIGIINTDEKYIINQRVGVVRKIDKAIPDQYIKYFLMNKTEKILEDASGCAQPNISPKQIGQYEFPKLGYSEMDHISVILDGISNVIAQRKQELQKFDDLIKARFVELFGDPVLNSREWPVCELSEYIQFLTSGSRGWAQYFTETGEYFITIKNVKNCRITLNDVQHIIPPDNAEAKRTRVKEGDLLISITADLGRTGVVSKEIADHGGFINQHLTCIRLDQSAVRPLYVAYYMESDAGKSQFLSKNQSAVKAGLNFNSINSLRLMVPPIELQDVFIAFVAQVDKSKFLRSIYCDRLHIFMEQIKTILTPIGNYCFCRN